MDYLPDCEIVSAKRQPLWWQERGLQQTSTGYGSKLSTSIVIQLSDKRWRRIYVCCYSNSGSAYVIVKGKRKYIGSSEFKIKKLLREC